MRPASNRRGRARWCGACWRESAPPARAGGVEVAGLIFSPPACGRDRGVGQAPGLTLNSRGLFNPSMGGHDHLMKTGFRRPTLRAQELRANPTEAERRLWRRLSARQCGDAKFSRQMPIGPYICDFLCRDLMLVIEVDGGQHAENELDAVRTRYLETLGYRVNRFWNNDVLSNTDGVVSTIFDVVRQPVPTPNPSRKREGSIMPEPSSSPPACGRGSRGRPAL